MLFQRPYISQIPTPSNTHLLYGCHRPPPPPPHTHTPKLFSLSTRPFDFNSDSILLLRNQKSTIIFQERKFICTGAAQPMDISSICSKDELLRYSVSFAGYGFFGDVVRDSEKLRWVGVKRYDLSGAKTFLANRCSISYFKNVSQFEKQVV